MKTLYVYFSRTSRTESAVLTLKRLMGGDERIVRIRPAVGYGGPFGFLRALFTMFAKKPVALLPGDPVDFADYDRVIVATPVWASHAPRPVRTFLQTHKGAKRTAYLATCGGGSCGELFDELDALTGCKREAALALDGMKGNAEQEIENFVRQISG